jgi:hypothetical protein
VHDGVFDCREVACRGRRVDIRDSQARGLSRRGIHLGEEGDQTAVAMQWAGVTETEAAPFGMAKGGPAFRVLSDAKNFRPTNGIPALAERLGHGFPHGDYDG